MNNNKKRYATVAIIFGGAVAGSAIVAGASNQRNYGVPFTSNGQRYYLPNDSRRALYPSREACMRDVPAARQAECEPANSYGGGRAGSWYGPVYTPRDAYQPGREYSTVKADASNVGKSVPKGANKTGFGSNGKAFTGSKGG